MTSIHYLLERWDHALVTVTMLRDALLSTALYVCLACAAPVLGTRYQRREAQKIAHKTKPSDTDVTAATPMTVALAGVGRIEIPESEAIPAGSMLVAPKGGVFVFSRPPT